MEAASADLRRRELAAVAPMHPRGRYVREGQRYLLCGTLGAEFDQWQRRLAAVSAADALLAQQLGLEAVEAQMDALEAEIRRELAGDERLLPRRSPGYGTMPLELSREILEKLDAPRRLGVSITDSLLLVPSKSVTAICAVERVQSC